MRVWVAYTSWSDGLVDRFRVDAVFSTETLARQWEGSGTLAYEVREVKEVVLDQVAQ